MDFQADLRRFALEQLEHYGVKYRKKDDLITLLIKLYTFFEKYIVPREREVLMARELEEKLPRLPPSVREALDKLAEWVRGGVDVNCFQSRGLYGQGSRDYQNMLYGIVHLHLSAKETDTEPVVKEGKRFAKPGSHLLYARFEPDRAYFLDVAEHPDSGESEAWTSKRAWETGLKNWPEVFGESELRGAYPCDQDGNPITIDDAAIAALTRAGVNTMIPSGGSLYAPGLGCAASGDSAQAVMRALRIKNAAAKTQLDFAAHALSILRGFRTVLERQGRPVPSKYDLHYDYLPALSRFVVCDRISHAAWDPQRGTVGLLAEREKT